MKKRNFLLLTFLLIFLNAQGQRVYEYDIITDFEFNIYSEIESILYKPEIREDFKQSTPEEVARTYFFGTSNEILSNLYLDKNKFLPKEQTNFDVVKETPKEDAYIKLLHKTNYSLGNSKMVYLMFIAKVKGINFSFPTLLSLIKKNNKWFIHQRPNQQKLSDCLIMFKSCVLSNLIEGKSLNELTKELINMTKTKKGNLDFIRLYDELVQIIENQEKSAELTMAENMVCDMDYKKQVVGKVNFTGVFEKIDVKKYDKDEQKDYKNLISLVKKNNDSIFLNEKMDITYNNKIFSVLKYDTFKGGIKKSVSSRIDGNAENYKPVQDLVILYQNLDTKIFNDLTPSIDKEKNKRQESEVLYQKTRGVYNVLNITKLYNLFIENKLLFTNYIYK